MPIYTDMFQLSSLLGIFRRACSCAHLEHLFIFEVWSILVAHRCCEMSLVVPKLCFLFVVCAAVVNGFQIISERQSEINRVKTVVVRSPPIRLRPGEVHAMYYYDIPTPKGHVAFKDWDSEMVTENGSSAPLNEVYVHHWSAKTFLKKKRSDIPDGYVRNNGICQDAILDHLFGFGSETRRTISYIPDPYAIEVGKPGTVPEGYELGWQIQIHAIDLRGTVSKFGCTECRCELFNVTVGGDGNALAEGYKGGSKCCYGGTQCRVREGFQGPVNTYYFQYTYRYLEWDDSIVPVRVYIMDATDTGERLPGSPVETGLGVHGCKTEYDIPDCANPVDAASCTHTQEMNGRVPVGGDFIYGVAHQHHDSMGMKLYGEDGRIICDSPPRVGTGSGAGNEEGFVVGFLACVPEPGTAKVYAGEKLRLTSTYSNAQGGHTGCMGLFYYLVDPSEISSKSALM